MCTSCFLSFIGELVWHSHMPEHPAVKNRIPSCLIACRPCLDWWGGEWGREGKKNLSPSPFPTCKKWLKPTLVEQTLVVCWAANEVHQATQHHPCPIQFYLQHPHCTHDALHILNWTHTQPVSKLSILRVSREDRHLQHVKGDSSVRGPFLLSSTLLHFLVACLTCTQNGELTCRLTPTPFYLYSLHFTHKPTF